MICEAVERLFKAEGWELPTGVAGGDEAKRTEIQ